eukprot:TRINITY_DN7176_c0_g1_i1.p1 TRINITY_DN7176_c0_g1~~TRINITY_DN7176_c0_g1_i1.p1  ORF type:complete len:1673 (-),score=350.74 TRINITY_DN7176_c0_g1_i1:51-5069(-)
MAIAHIRESLHIGVHRFRSCDTKLLAFLKSFRPVMMGMTLEGTGALYQRYKAQVLTVLFVRCIGADVPVFSLAGMKPDGPRLFAFLHESADIEAVSQLLRDPRRHSGRKRPVARQPPAFPELLKADNRVLGLTASVAARALRDGCSAEIISVVIVQCALANHLPIQMRCFQGLLDGQSLEELAITTSIPLLRDVLQSVPLLMQIASEELQAFLHQAHGGWTPRFADVVDVPLLVTLCKLWADGLCVSAACAQDLATIRALIESTGVSTEQLSFPAMSSQPDQPFQAREQARPDASALNLHTAESFLENSFVRSVLDGPAASLQMDHNQLPAHKGVYIERLHWHSGAMLQEHIITESRKQQDDASDTGLEYELGLSAEIRLQKGEEPSELVPCILYQNRIIRSDTRQVVHPLEQLTTVSADAETLHITLSFWSPSLQAAYDHEWRMAGILPDRDERQAACLADLKRECKRVRLTFFKHQEFKGWLRTLQPLAHDPTSSFMKKRMNAGRVKQLFLRHTEKYAQSLHGPSATTKSKAQVVLASSAATAAKERDCTAHLDNILSRCATEASLKPEDKVAMFDQFLSATRKADNLPVVVRNRLLLQAEMEKFALVKDNAGPADVIRLLWRFIDYAPSPAQLATATAAASAADSKAKKPKKAKPGAKQKQPKAGPAADATAVGIGLQPPSNTHIKNMLKALRAQGFEYLRKFVPCAPDRYLTRGRIPDVVDPDAARVILSELGAELPRRIEHAADLSPEDIKALERDRAQFHQALGFVPDDWQVGVLKAIDAGTSVVVSAPTSAGKTFISTYCIDKVLKQPEGHVVFVAPTKALVNQVCADMYRFFERDWGVFTRDYRYNITSCRILVTVPQCLEIMMLASGCLEWRKSLRYVIFDEVHCIQEHVSGRAWEHLLLTVPCPFLALSATIGNGQQFYEWLKQAKLTRQVLDTQAGCEQPPAAYVVRYIEHVHRAVDQTRFVWDDDSMTHLHPLAMFEADVDQPQNLAITPKEALQLFDAMAKCSHEHSDEAARGTIAAYVPREYFGPLLPVISRNQVQRYAEDLLTVLWQWSAELRQHVIAILNTIPQLDTPRPRHTIRRVVDLVMHLHEEERLPAIMFNHSRSQCLQMATAVEVECAKRNAVSQMKHMKSYVPQVTGLQGPASRNQLDVRAEARVVLAPLRQHTYTLAPHSLSDSELDELLEPLYHSLGDKAEAMRRPHVRALRHGVGVHHAGMSRKYREAVEVLFRKRALGVVFATGTLAMGIHMPCRTVALVRDSPHLNVLGYRQMSGRAGRRGLDLQGEVIFYHVPATKITRLLCCPVPASEGEFSMSATLLLRMLQLHAQSSDPARDGASLVMIIKQPLRTHATANKAIAHNTMNMFLRFALEHLRHFGLINDQAVPIGLTPIVTHLHFTEPANFACVYLLQSGALRAICAPSRPWQAIAVDLLVIMSTLFGQVRFNSNILGAHCSTGYIPKGMLVLPALSASVQAVFDEYNHRVMTVYQQCQRGFILQQRDGAHNAATLPISRVSWPNAATFCAPADSIEAKLCENLPDDVVPNAFAMMNRSKFHSLLHANDFADDLVLPPTALPKLDLSIPCNAVFVDLFVHQSVDLLTTENGLSEGELFPMFQSFVLNLRAVDTALHPACVSVPQEDECVVDALHQLAVEYHTLFKAKFQYH